MSTSFQHDCPHCRTRCAGFRVIAQHVHRTNSRQNFAVAVCGVCDFPSIYHYRDADLSVRTATPIDLLRSEINFPADRFLIINVWPQVTGDTPTDLPENVARFFEQGVQNERAENWDAAGAMFRKSLDVATKILDSDNANKTLFQRINLLAASGRLTADLAVWAHEVRIDGNESVHGDEPETVDDVSAIHQFCRAVLLYCFSLPALVATRSSQAMDA